MLIIVVNCHIIKVYLYTYKAIITNFGGTKRC